MTNKAIDLIQSSNAKWVDLRFTDPKGKEQHVTVPASTVDSEFFTNGQMFDGSSIEGWQSIDKSDMIMTPIAESAVIDPFVNDITVNLRCNIIDPTTFQNYFLDPRSIALKAEEHLKYTGIGDTAFFGPEPEFFIFDDVAWKVEMQGSMYAVDSYEGAWNSDGEFEDGNLGHRPKVKGGYFPVPPVDSSHEIRNAMCEAMEAMGLVIEVHHHEVATANQNEIGTRFNTLVNKADEVQILKYCVANVAEQFGKTATFMPKPLVGDNGSGMHVHQSISKDGQNIFAGDKYAGLSETALYYIGGIIKHARALNAFTNASTNSYKRLVPGFEAPVMLAYSSRNRSASIRIPFVQNPKGKRIEVRFPDPTANPYLAFSALLMAGLDGINNKILPGDPADKDLYDLPPEEAKGIPTVCSSLEMALEHLDKNRGFLLAGDVFTNEMIDAYINLKMSDVTELRLHTHPIEFDMYYSL